MKIQGFKEEIVELKSRFLEEIYQEIERISDKLVIVQYPDEWTPQEDYYSLVNLMNSDQEYTQIEGNFFRTMEKTIKVLKIKRIQNKILYSSYYKARSQMMEYKEIINERVLFHGRGLTSPKVICE